MPLGVADKLELFEGETINRSGHSGSLSSGAIKSSVLTGKDASLDLEETFFFSRNKTDPKADAGLYVVVESTFIMLIDCLI